MKKSIHIQKQFVFSILILSSGKAPRQGWRGRGGWESEIICWPKPSCVLMTAQKCTAAPRQPPVERKCVLCWGVLHSAWGWMWSRGLRGEEAKEIEGSALQVNNVCAGSAARQLRPEDHQIRWSTVTKDSQVITFEETVQYILHLYKKIVIFIKYTIVKIKVYFYVYFTTGSVIYYLGI